MVDKVGGEEKRADVMRWWQQFRTHRGVKGYFKKIRCSPDWEGLGVDGIKEQLPNAVEVAQEGPLKDFFLLGALAAELGRQILFIFLFHFFISFSYFIFLFHFILFVFLFLFIFLF